MSLYRESASGLLNALRGVFDRTTRANALVLVSLSGLDLDHVNDKVWPEYGRIMHLAKDRSHGQMFQVSREDYAFLTAFDNFDEVGFSTQIRLDMLKLVQEFFPIEFSQLNQSRLIRTIDLNKKLKNAILIASRWCEEMDHTASDQQSTDKRRLSEADILKVESVAATFGATAFVQRYIEWQPVVLWRRDETPTPIMTECFISMRKLIDEIMKDIDLRGSGNAFTLLTQKLDRIMLEALPSILPPNQRISINLNVESVFTRSFEQTMDALGSMRLRNVIFEFKQDNILRSFEEYSLAAEIINKRGGIIAIDAITPETIGVVNLDRLNARFAKIFWRSGAESFFVERREDLKRFQQQGVVVVMGRIDDDAALDICHEAKINLLQGFYVDSVLSAPPTGSEENGSLPPIAAAG